MNSITKYLIPLVILFILAYGLVKGVDVFDVFISGAKDGLKTSVSILPALIALMTCVGMFKASGGLDVLTAALEPVTALFHAPKEIIPLALLRPISGSGALVVFEDILKSYGPDSSIGRTASVMMGSTETTFYTMAVYFGATHIQKTRHTLACSVSSDITGFLMSAVLIYLLL